MHPSAEKPLRVLRAARGWSQAERLSVSRQTVSAIETEKHGPGLPPAFELACGQPLERVLDDESAA